MQNDNIRPFKAEDINQMEIHDKNSTIFRIPHLLQVYESLGTSFTYLDNDKVQASGGVVGLWAGMGEVWFVLSDDEDKPTKTICSIVKKFIDGLYEEGFYRLQATIKADNEKAIRFIEWLGFEREALMKKYGIEGADYYLYARI